MEKERVDIKVGEAFDNLYRAGWKIQGVAGLFKLRAETENADTTILQMTHTEALGIGFLLEQMAEDILKNAEKVEGYVNVNTKRLSS